MRDALVAEVVRKPRRAAKAANPGRQRVAQRNLRAPCIGIDRVDPLAHEHGCEVVGIACPAQDEGAHV